jgi:hypothetical protein
MIAGLRGRRSGITWGALMRAASLRLLTIAALVAASTTALASAAGAAPGTFTKITTPSGATKTIQIKAPPAITTLTVSGQASSDVTSVDIDCILLSANGPAVTVLKAAVPVTGNAFSDVVTIPNLIANCRMRAVPHGVDTGTEYLGAYTGPILYMWAFVPVKDGSTTVGYQALAERGDGIALATDAASCGPAVIATVAPPTMTVLGLGSQACTVALPSGNVTTSGTSTASSIKVSGHNAYLPGTISTYLRGTLALTLPQPALTTSMARASNGDLTITESAPLRRCSVSDLYPPTLVSCPTLTGTGVTFKRVTSLIRGSHQVRVRDTFTSTDGHAHPVSLQYLSQAEAPDAGAPGYLFPGRAHFVTALPDQVITGLGTKAATVFIRSDIRAFEGEQSADTRALTWSRAPSKIQFSHVAPTRQFATPFALSVPSGGNAYLGFAVSDANRTSEVKPLGALATGEMMNTPSITSPANHAHLHGHSITVKGGVTRGANGLPISVSVNGHAATLTVVSAAQATYKVTFSLPFGTHTITATATDIAHNTRTRSISIQNTA